MGSPAVRSESVVVLTFLIHFKLVFGFGKEKNDNKYFEEDMMFGAKEIFACLPFFSTL